MRRWILGLLQRSPDREQVITRNLSWLRGSGTGAIREVELCYRGVKYTVWFG